MLCRSTQKVLVYRGVPFHGTVLRKWASSLVPIRNEQFEPNASNQPRSVFGGSSLKDHKKMSQRFLDATIQLSTSKHKAQLLREKFGVSSTELDDPAAAAAHARRLAQIVTMPLEGATPFIKPKVELFTTDIDEYFLKFPREEKTYNSFILGLSERGLAADARSALEDMRRHRVKQNAYHWTSFMKSCVVAKDPDQALQILEEMKSHGIQPTVWTIDVILEACVAAGQLDRAYELYSLVKQHDLVPNTEIFTTLIKGCLQIDKDYERAWQTFNHMRVYHAEPDVVLYTLMIHICAKEEKVEKAFNLLEEMRAMDVRPTDLTYNTLIYACARRIDYYDEAFRLLEEMKREGFTPSFITLNNILNVCAKSGDVATAELTFDEIMRLPEAAGNEGNDKTKEVIANGEKVWSRMLDAGISPSVHSFNNRIRLYSQCYRLNRAMAVKDEMKQKFGIAPVVHTYNILIRMFSHARRVERAFDQVNIMKAVEKLEPNKSTYIELIVGCTKEFYVQSGMKLLREMKAQNLLIGDANAQWVNDFRRQLVKFPWLVREIDEMTGKADIPVAPWRHPGVKRKIRYYRDLTPEEEKRSPLFR